MVNLKKLFKVLVLGGSALVAAAKCGSNNLQSPPSSDGGNPGGNPGGGPPGW